MSTPLDRVLLKLASVLDSGHEAGPDFDEMVRAIVDNRVQLAVDLASALWQPKHDTTREFSPMHLAAYFDRPDVIRALHAAGFDINLRIGPCLVSPFFIATCTGKVDAMRKLCELGADPDATSCNPQATKTYTPLTMGITRSSPAMVGVLLALGASANHPVQMHGWTLTPLHIAASSDQGREIFELLLAHGADPSAVGSESKSTPSKSTCCCTVDAIYRGLKKHLHLRVTPFQLACIFMKQCAVAAMVQTCPKQVALDVNANICPIHGTMLHLAAHTGNVKLLHTLLDLGARDYVRDAQGDRPLDVALSNANGNHMSIVSGRMHVINALMTSDIDMHTAHTPWSLVHALHTST
jgi:ankyrin repeat protein